MPSKGAVGVSGLPHEEPPFGYLGASPGGGRGGGAEALSYLDACVLLVGFGRGGDARRSGQVKVRAREDDDTNGGWVWSIGGEMLIRWFGKFQRWK